MMLMGSWWDRRIEPSLIGTKASTKMAEVQTPAYSKGAVRAAGKERSR